MSLSTEERLFALLEQENLSRATEPAKEKVSGLGQYYRDVLDSAPCPTITTAALDGTITYRNRAASRLWGGKGSATVVATPLVEEGINLGAVILFEDTTRATAQAGEIRRLKEKRQGG